MQDSKDHASMEILSSEECFELLQTVPVGRVAFNADAKVQIFPVTFAVQGEKILYRSQLGSKLDAADMHRQVSFEADDWDPEDRSGWSVVASGRTQAIDADEVDVELTPWLDAEMEWIQILVEEISGRRLPND